MASAVLGKVSPTPKGEYVSTQDYDRLDVVTYDGYPYLAKSNVPSGNLPTDELYWMPLLTGLDFAPGGYGLGGQVPLTTADAAVQTGFYRIWLQNTLGYTGYVNLMVMNNNDQIISQTAFGAGNKVFLRIYYNTWGDWVDLSPSAFAPSGYGLGTSATYIIDLNNAKENGFYYWNTAAVNAPFNPAHGGGEMIVLKRNENAVHQIAYDATRENLKCVRQYSGGTWGEWEWVNPPMELGVEYRTTERFNGRPVYTKAVNCGAMGQNTVDDLFHDAANIAVVWVSGGYWFDGSTLFSIPYIGGSNDNQIFVSAYGSAIHRVHKGSVYNILDMTVMIKYTKGTD